MLSLLFVTVVCWLNKNKQLLLLSLLSLYVVVIVIVVIVEQKQTVVVVIVAVVSWLNKNKQHQTTQHKLPTAADPKQQISRHPGCRTGTTNMAPGTSVILGTWGYPG